MKSKHDGPYKIIMADPPWSFGDKMVHTCMQTERHYPTQSTEWIKSLKVDELAAKDSVLFLWAVSALLPEAIEVMEAWGFKYKTVAFCWVKKTTTGKAAHTLGKWTLGGMELCLLGVKGKPQRERRNIRQIIEATRPAHSVKPAEVRERIVELMGDLPRLEMFSRERADGWDCFGNEVEGSILIESRLKLSLDGKTGGAGILSPESGMEVLEDRKRRSPETESV